MAPTLSKPVPEQPLLGTRKCFLAASLADPSNVDAAAIKRRRIEQAATLHQLRQPSVETVPDDEDNPTTLNHPRKATNIIEAADGSDDDDDDRISESGRTESSLGDVNMPGLMEEGASVDDEKDVEAESESEDAELERLLTEWVSPIYAFFGRTPEVTYGPEGRRAHEFRCASSQCKGKGSNGRVVRRYLDTSDRKSTSNLKRHAITCWGKETVDAALEAKVDIDSTRNTLKTVKDGSITAAFERKRKGKVSYSHRPHTRAETRVEIVRWVSESMRPFSIVEDRGFCSLMKTGRPEHYLPSRPTVARDVKEVFLKVRKRIGMMLQVYTISSCLKVQYLLAARHMTAC
ncbi:hypothetical protein BYT27DRAFT_7089536 [Phlegmacium glaucopus]|nr:hypothetical protein BYT27DRAFT_7089536 [Phlegmacium glaucopus]